MLAAKGKSFPDGTYEYTCGKCGGTGWNGRCDWCCGGDFEAVRAALGAGVRGQQYYSLLKEFLRIAGKALVAEAKSLRVEQSRITPIDIAYLSLRFGLNLKATWEWLEECGVIATGTHVEFQRTKTKVGTLNDLARQKYGEIEQWRPTR